jgi:hypothetical protein
MEESMDNDVSYGYKMTWRPSPSKECAVEVDNCDSPDAARIVAVLSAAKLGWQPPRWWQWWRWSEVKQPLFPVVMWFADSLNLESPLKGEDDETSYYRE